jgi:hypothetical protein
VFVSAADEGSLAGALAATTVQAEMLEARMVNGDAIDIATLCTLAIEWYGMIDAIVTTRHTTATAADSVEDVPHSCGALHAQPGREARSIRKATRTKTPLHVAGSSHHARSGVFDIDVVRGCERRGVEIRATV